MQSKKIVIYNNGVYSGEGIIQLLNGEVISLQCSAMLDRDNTRNAEIYGEIEFAIENGQSSISKYLHLTKEASIDLESATAASFTMVDIPCNFSWEIS